MREPYRVAVWGPGTMGKGVIRELLRLPETQLVSTLAYSTEKSGVDVGTLVGQESVGVKVTTHFGELLAAKPEVVIHTARDFGDFRGDADIIRLLESGINVISVLPYQYPAARGESVHQRFDEAGKRGGATLHGSGIDPGFFYERLAATMTGISNDIQWIRLEEYSNVKNLTDHKILELYGFGTPMEAVLENQTAANMAQNYLTMGMHYLADHLGVPLEHIERTSDHRLTDRDVTIRSGFTAKSGTVGSISFEWTGFTRQKKPMFQIKTVWYLDDSLRPPRAKGDDYWLLEIEGLPSARVGVELKGSLLLNSALAERNPVPAAYLATIIPAIQAIPAVVAAPPGVLVAAMPQFHWKADMRG